MSKVVQFEQRKVAVDIVIPVHGRADLVSKCLASLEGSTQISYKLILVDDASNDSTLNKVLADAKDQGATVLRNNKNQGFAGTCNRGAQIGKSSLICLLNTDVEVTSNWLEPLVAEFEDKNVGIVGPKILFASQSGRPQPLGPEGKVQSCGMAFNTRKAPYHRLISWDTDHFKVNMRRDDLQAITGACIVVRRALWDVIKGLNTDYISTYEDMELCLQARRLGYKVVYNPLSTVHHLVAGSAERVGGFPINRAAAIFFSKWSSFIQYDEYKLL